MMSQTLTLTLTPPGNANVILLPLHLSCAPFICMNVLEATDPRSSSPIHSPLHSHAVYEKQQAMIGVNVLSCLSAKSEQ